MAAFDYNFNFPFSCMWLQSFFLHMVLTYTDLLHKHALMWMFHFSQQIGASRSTVVSKQQRILCKVMSYQVFNEAESSSLNLNSEGSVHPVRGSLQWNSPLQSHIKGLPEISMGLDSGWEIHYSDHSFSAVHEGGGRKTFRVASCWLSHIFSLYYYKILQD